MACKVGEHLRSFLGEVKCSPIPSSVIESKIEKLFIKTLSLQQSLQQTIPNLEMDDISQVCDKCIKSCGRRRLNQCQNTQHPGKRGRHEKKLHFVTAEEYLSTHKCLGLLRNDGICRNPICNPL